MSSRRGATKAYFAVRDQTPSQGKVTSPNCGFSSGGPGSSNTKVEVEELHHDVTKIGPDSNQNGEQGGFSRNSKNGTAGNALKWESDGSATNVRAQPDAVPKHGVRNGIGTLKYSGTSRQTRISNSKQINGSGNSSRPSNRDLETCGKWIGLWDSFSDRQIVWPPMIFVMNNQLEMDDKQEKWIGMGKQELLDHFHSYKAVIDRHVYGLKGQTGFSILIFERSAIGYLEAERLDKHFADQGTGRYAWINRGVHFYPVGKRQLFGYMARKEDVNYYNKHCEAKTRVNFEMKSYQDVVVLPLRKMREDNEQLQWLRDRVAKEEIHSKALEESFTLVSQKLRKTMEENCIVRQRTKVQHERNKEEMDYQEEFFKEQIKVIQQALKDKERILDELMQEKREKMKQSAVYPRTQELWQDKIAEFLQSEDKSIEQFKTEREELIRMHEFKKDEMKLRHNEEDVELQKEFESSLTKLMERYAPHGSDEVKATTSSVIQLAE